MGFLKCKQLEGCRRSASAEAIRGFLQAVWVCALSGCVPLAHLWFSFGYCQLVVVVVVVWLLVAGACKRGDLLTFCLTKLFNSEGWAVQTQ